MSWSWLGVVFSGKTWDGYAFANLIISCSFTRSRVCHGEKSFYASMAVTAVSEQKPSESGLGAARTAHHYARPTALAPPPATSFGIRRLTTYAPVSLSCVVKAHPPALVLWP